jgi:RNAse (barnase) inhibitor barstar
MKRKITIEIENGADVEEFYDKVQKALGFVFARNLDALHDVLSEYGDGVTIIIKNGSNVPDDVKRVLKDLQKEMADFSAIFGEGNSEGYKADSRSSAGKRLLKVVLWAIGIITILAIWTSLRQ